MSWVYHDDNKPVYIWMDLSTDSVPLPSFTNSVSTAPHGSEDRKCLFLTRSFAGGLLRNSKSLIQGFDIPSVAHPKSHTIKAWLKIILTSLGAKKGPVLGSW